MSLQKDLYEAIRSGNKSKILDLLQEDVDLSLSKATFGEVNNTALHLAFESVGSTEGQLIEILEIFLDRGLNINAKNEEEKTILQLAVERRMRDVIDFCLLRKADPNLTYKRWSSIAHFVIKEEHRKLNTCRCVEDEEKESADFVDWMLSRGVDFYYKKNILGLSSLYWANELELKHIVLTLLKRIDDLPAAEKNQTPLLIVFLKRNGNYNSRYVYDIVKLIFEKNQSMSFETINKALRLAINSEQSLNVIALLLKATTNERVGGLQASMAIDLFRLHPNLQMLSLLKESGTDFKSARSRCGDNFLHLVSRRNWANESGMIEFLIDAGCDVNAYNSKGETPLQVAMTSKHGPVAEELIDHGAQIDVTFDDGTTTLIVVACKMGHAWVLKKLIEHGADLNYKDEDDRTLLHLAVDDSRGITWLLENGLDVNAKDKMGKTPLHYAIHDFIVKVLFGAGAHVDAVDNQGHTPLYESLCRQNSRLVEELLKCGADMRDPKVFKLTLECVNQQPHFIFDDSRYLKRHLIKLTVAGSLDDTSYVPEGFEEEEVQKFVKECLLEVELL